MTDYPKEPKLHDFLKDMEAKAGNLNTVFLAGAIPIADHRTDEFLENMVDSFLFCDTKMVEDHLQQCLHRTLIATNKQSLKKTILYVTHVDQEEWYWRYVFGKILLDTEVHVPTRDQIHECYVWRIKCLKADIRIPPLPKETRDNVERMFLRKIIAQVYAHADMLYTPLATWENVIDEADLRMRKRVEEKIESRLEAARSEAKFLAETGAPKFMQLLADRAVIDLKAIYREVKLPDTPD